MKQSETFLQGEGDAMFERTGGKAERWPDPVIEAIKECKLDTPQTAIEFGCGNGWRLAEIKKLGFPWSLTGYEPSEQAVKESLYPKVFRAAALEALKKIRTGHYTIVIFGFCLYLIDREDLLMVAAHTDRILRDGGHIIIIDFYHHGPPFAVPYRHNPTVLSYHMDHSMLWLGHPGYKTVLVNYGYYADDGSVVTVLKKDFASAFPEKKESNK